MLLAAALVLLLPAAPSQAQSATTFVKNTDQDKTSVHTSVGNGWRMAGTFTTGSNSAGYTLESVGIYVSAWNGNVGNFTASIWSTTSSGAPDSSLYTLTNPTTTSGDAVNTFTVSNATLDASTTYAVVMAVSNGTVAVWMTTSDDEDGGAASGWSIGDTRHQSNNQGSWQTDSMSRTPMVEITGTLGTSSGTGPAITIAAGTSAVTEGAAAEFTVTADSAPSADLTVNLTVSESGDFVASGDEGSATVTITASNTTATLSVPTVNDSADETDGTVTATVATGTGYTVGSTASADVTVNDDDDTLVANTTQTDGGDASLANDHAQAFTTGSNGTGYKLTGVDLELELSSGNAPTYTVKIFRSNEVGGSDVPFGEVGELTQQGTLTSSAGLVRFTHTPPGLDLIAETTYFVVLDVTAGATANAKAGRTSGKGEDSGALAGWSIADQRLHRGASATSVERARDGRTC